MLVLLQARQDDVEGGNNQSAAEDIAEVARERVVKVAGQELAGILVGAGLVAVLPPVVEC